MYPIARLFALVLAFFAAIPAATAQSEKTILVLDASGSMWGQIDGVNKIVIAKQAINDLLDTLPEGTELGLSAYGHRQKGQCSDIQTLVEPGADTRQAIRDAVAAINPRGMTPLSDAVLRAAETLKYEEEKATVILLSDGIETCDRDPCAIGSELEKVGIDFTAHVIGFDVNAEADRAQLACLAENTGGRFLAASNAAELSEALSEVAETPAPPPAPTTADAEFVATLEENGPTITEGIAWDLTPQAEDGTKLNGFEMGVLRMGVRPGAYRVTVNRPETGDSVYRDVIIQGGQENRVVLVLPNPTPDASVSGPSTSPIGAPIAVQWEGPGEELDQITAATTDARPGEFATYAYVSGGTPTELRTPSKPGEYEIRYLWNNQVLATQTLTATPLEVTLEAADEAVIASTIPVGHDGPDYEMDIIVVAKPDQNPGEYINYTYINGNDTVELALPAEPGDYELRYVMALDQTILGTRPITVTEVPITLSAPETGSAGSAIVVEWDGPDGEGDYISIAEVDSRSGQYIAYEYTESGNPTPMILPGVPGTYEVRYIIGQDNTLGATRTVTVTDPVASVSGPETALIGSEVKVDWTGPDNEGDYVTVAETDSAGNEYESYSYLSDGSPVRLIMPGKPGEYELRYVLDQKNVVLAMAIIKVEDVSATLTAPAEAEVGSRIAVEWDGPDNEGDYVTIAQTGDSGNVYSDYSYTNEGSPVSLRMPPKPGTYELRYVLDKGNKVITSVPITLTPASASFDAPNTAEVGSELVAAWIGPDNEGDYVTIAKAGDAGNEYQSYVYTSQGNPARLKVPAEVGEYELRYVLDSGNSVIERVALTVTDVQATLTPPEKAEIGSQIVVDWEGPGNDGDYITIAQPDQAGNQYVSYAYASQGSPARLDAPAEAGQYELRYVLGTGSRVIGRAPITVTEVEASVTAPEKAEAGSEVAISWTGPDNDYDYIAIANPDDPDNGRVHYTHTNKGNPLRLKLPAEAGEYELRYVLHNGTRVISRTPVTVTEVEASVTAPEKAEVGSEIAVEWAGPDNDHDYIAIAEANAPDNSRIHYTRTKTGNPLRLKMPAEAGEYELRYVLHNGTRVIGRTPLAVTEVEASVTPPEKAEVGSEIVVEWTGPDNANDYIAVANLDDPDSQRIHYTRTRKGNPLRLKMPAEAGEYELRYVLYTGKRVLSRAPLTVTEATATVATSTVAETGTVVLVEWTGPENSNDYIGLAEAGSADDQRVSYIRVEKGSPMRFQLPAEPGEYEFRYVLNNGRKVIARTPITVTGSTATLTAPETVVAGAQFVVEFTGPEADRDRISIAEPDSRDHERRGYAWTRDGSPLRLTAPGETGTYELRYTIGLKDGVIARTPLTVTPAEATLEAPGTAPAGTEILVNWTGPDYDRDIIALARLGDSSGQRKSHARTSDGPTVRLTVPEKPGDYELRYIISDGTVIARLPLKVE
ncbi:VWA domain-containing protein [Halovulum sp. GXIMD14793]